MDFKHTIDYGYKVWQGNRRLQVDVAWTVDGRGQWNHMACWIGFYPTNGDDWLILQSRAYVVVQKE